MTPAVPTDARITRWMRWAMIAGYAGLLLLLTSYFVNSANLLRSYLFAYVFWTGLGIGSLGILLLHHTVGGKWGLMIRQPCESAARTLPYMGLLILPVLANLPVVYMWAGPDGAQDPEVQKKAAYLNPTFFVLRTLLYFAVFTFYALRLAGLSRSQDEADNPQRATALAAKMRRLSAPGLVVFTVTATFAFIDWVMSLEPHWFSTIYGAMFLVGQVLSALALAITIVVSLRDYPSFRENFTSQHAHDLGNLMFAFTMLWAYLSFSQFLIIWAGNLPEEIPWYLRRLGEGWGSIALFLVLFHFFVPFLLMLQRDVKRRPELLLQMSIFMLAVRVVDVFWVVAPAFYGDRFQVYWTDLAAFVGLGGVWLTIFLRLLRQYPLLPVRDERLRGAPKEMVVY